MPTFVSAGLLLYKDVEYVSISPLAVASPIQSRKQLEAYLDEDKLEHGTVVLKVVDISVVNTERKNSLIEIKREDK